MKGKRGRSRLLIEQAQQFCYHWNKQKLAWYLQMGANAAASGSGFMDNPCNFLNHAQKCLHHAFFSTIIVNVVMNAMKRKVADTPGPDAMAGREIFAEKFIFKMSEKEG
jgi:hypothetical protein